MKNKFKTLALVLASTGMLLTSCGDETVYPSLDHSDGKIEIVDTATNPTFTKEDLDTIYEKLHDSSSHGQDVRDIIIENVADQVVGSFKIVGSDVKLVGYDIKEDGSATNDEEKLAFVKTHNAYWNKSQVNGKFTPVEPTALDGEITNRVTVIKNIVKEKIVTKLFDEANSDLYKDHHYFQEVKFAREKFKTSKINAKDKDNNKEFSYEDTDKTVNIYDKKYEAEDSKIFYNHSFIDSSVSKENPDSITSTMLHLDYYEDYINREILPSIVNTLLVEQYVFDNQYVSLSRTQARKVNYVAIQATEKTNDKAQLLINTFVNGDYIKKTTDEATVNFDLLANAWKGLATPEATNLLEASKAFTKIANHYEALGKKANDNSLWYGIEDQSAVKPFYKETEFGQLMLDYAKINDNRHDSESNSKQKDFTNSGKYSVTKGLQYKYDDIAVKDYTTTAWGTKDNGFSALPSNIKDTLFEYSVSSDVKVNPTVSDNYEIEGHVVLYRGHYFLKNPKTPSNPGLEDLIVHYDAGSKTFYIVEVLEALSQAKLSYGEETNAYDANKREEISREIGYDIASTDTYKNTAYNKYLEACKIEYHDQSIYDYMKETYPDLFEEEE